MTTIKQQLQQQLDDGFLGPRLQNLEVTTTTVIRFERFVQPIQVLASLSDDPCHGCIFRLSTFGLTSRVDGRQCAFIHYCTSPNRPDRTSVVFANYRPSRK